MAGWGPEESVILLPALSVPEGVACDVARRILRENSGRIDDQKLFRLSAMIGVAELFYGNYS